MRGHSRRCVMAIVLVSSISVASFAFGQPAGLKLRDDEIGAVDSRGYLFGSSVQVSRNGEFVTIRSRVVNGSKSASTVEWHSAGIREPVMAPGEARSRVQRVRATGWLGPFLWPVEFDYGHWGGHSATIETRMGTLAIDGAPAFLTRIAMVEVAGKVLIEKFGALEIETIFELLLKGRKTTVKLVSQGKADSQGVAFAARIENEGPDPVYVQWVGLGSGPNGALAEVGAKERKTVVERRYAWPVYVVNDVAFANGDSLGTLPGSAVRYLGRELKFVPRVQELTRLKLGSNAMLLAPTLVGGE